MSLFDQPRFPLATLPTPLHPLERLSEHLGGPRILIKRDDLTGLALGGNKTRKLEYLLADALAHDATHLITEGGWQSNHCRQTAAAARAAGLESALVLNCPHPDPPDQGNLLLDRLFGAAVHRVTESRERKPRMSALADELRRAGHRPYVIPTGGSDAVGSLAYAAAALELHQQLLNQGVRPRRLYTAWGSGGTFAGLALGAALFAAPYELLSVLVVPADSAQEGIDDAWPIITAMCQRLAIANPVDKAALRCDAEHIGAGYGVPTPEALDAIRLLARTEGILLDPVYTAKAFAAMIDHIRAGELTRDDTVVFLHTGGAPVLFDRVEHLRPILE